MVGRQLPVFSVIVPFWLVWAMVGMASDDRGLAGLLDGGIQFRGVSIPRQQLSRTVASRRGQLDRIDRLAGYLVASLATATLWRFEAEDSSAGRPPIEQANALEAIAPSREPAPVWRETWLAWLPG